MDTITINTEFGEMIITAPIYLLDDINVAFETSSIYLHQHKCDTTASRYGRIAESLKREYNKVVYGSHEISDNPYQE